MYIIVHFSNKIICQNIHFSNEFLKYFNNWWEEIKNFYFLLCSGEDGIFQKNIFCKKF